MALHRFATVDVFTRQRFGGNPLAVFPQAAGIAEADLQRLAAELNLSETTFVLPPKDAANTARVRIFNRSHEMPFAGHPMVGTAFVLASLEASPPGAYTFEVPAGLVEVKLRSEEGKVRGAVIEAPQSLKIGLELPAREIAGAAGLENDAVLTASHPPLLASVGNTYVIAEVGREALEKASPDLAIFRQVRQKYEGLENRFSLYLYARSGNEIHARMFAPLAGTWEDPATGSAATPLAALLLQLSGGDRAEFAIHQGTQMGRPSLLETAAWRTTDGIRASVGGDCVPVLRGEAEL
jgi:trans-2,3-dihydro-3-hydroxyanthranilate isomerase